VHVGALTEYQTNERSQPANENAKEILIIQSETCGVRNLVLVNTVLVFLLFVILLIFFLI